MSYLNRGFSSFLQKQNDFYPEKKNEKETNQLIDQFESNKILPSGNISARDKNIEYNLNKSVFRVTDGARVRFQAGRFEDGTYGMRAWDENGNIVINISGNTTQIN